MNYILVLFGVVSTVYAVKYEVHKLPQEKVVTIQEKVNPCALENNVDPGMLARFTDGTLPRDEATNKYLFCVARTTGLIKEDGHMVIDKIASYLGNHPLLEKFKEVLNKCNEVTKEDPIATAVEMHSCYTNTAPVHFSI